MTGQVTQAWRQARARFRHLQSFVTESNQPGADVRYRQSLYCAWVLLAYAAAEGTFVELGKAATEVIGSRIAAPGNLPVKIRDHHRERTLRHVLTLVKEPDYATWMGAVEAPNWPTYSRLLSLERNVWVNEIRGWFSRLEGADTLEWLTSLTADAQETLESRWNRLVEVRNDIAHGELPAEIATAEVVGAWIESYETFARHSVASLHQVLAKILDVAHCSHVGEVDTALSLGSSTIAFKELGCMLSLGDHVLLGDSHDVQVGRILSIQRHGDSLEEAPIAMNEVAVTLSCEHENRTCREAF